MVSAEKNVGLCCKKLKKLQSPVLKLLAYDSFISVTDKQDAEIAETVLDILHDLDRLRFVQDELVAFLAEALYHLHKSIRGKGVVLGGNTETQLGRLVTDKTVFEQLHLLNHTSCVAKKFQSLFCQSDTLTAPVKNRQLCFFFDIFDCIGKARL